MSVGVFDLFCGLGGGGIQVPILPHATFAKRKGSQKLSGLCAFAPLREFCLGKGLFPQNGAENRCFGPSARKDAKRPGTPEGRECQDALVLGAPEAPTCRDALAGGRAAGPPAAVVTPTRLRKTRGRNEATRPAPDGALRTRLPTLTALAGASALPAPCAPHTGRPAGPPAAGFADGDVAKGGRP